MAFSLGKYAVDANLVAIGSAGTPNITSGADDVGTDDANFGNFTAARDTVQGALEGIDTQIGSITGAVDDVQIIASSFADDTGVSSDWNTTIGANTLDTNGQYLQFEYFFEATHTAGGTDVLAIEVEFPNGSAEFLYTDSTAALGDGTYRVRIQGQLARTAASGATAGRGWTEILFLGTDNITPDAGTIRMDRNTAITVDWSTSNVFNVRLAGTNWASTQFFKTIFKVVEP